MIKICIPSYKRPNDVVALKHVSPELQQKWYWLCVRDEELEDYKSNYPHCNYLNLGSDFGDRGIVETRQRINEMMSGKIIIIDDDVEFNKTKVVIKEYKGEPFHYMRYDKDVKPNDVLEEMLDYIDGLMDTYPFGSVRAHGHPRDGRKFMPYIHNQVGLWCVWFNLDVIDTDLISYRQGPEYAEDVYMSLRMYEEGYDCIQLSKYCIKKSKSTNSQSGGCNVSDRGLRHDQSVEWLVKEYPHMCSERQSILYGGTKAVRVKFVRRSTSLF